MFPGLWHRKSFTALEIFIAALAMIVALVSAA
jgi:hypothetical protein